MSFNDFGSSSDILQAPVRAGADKRLLNWRSGDFGNGLDVIRAVGASDHRLQLRHIVMMFGSIDRINIGIDWRIRAAGTILKVLEDRLVGRQIGSFCPKFR